MPGDVVNMTAPEGRNDKHTPVREACRAYMDAHGLSIATAAREMGRGCSQATLSQWLSGRYAGDMDAVTERVQRWIETRASLARHDLSGAGLDRHVDIEVTGRVRAALRYAHAESDIVCVIGPSGTGKTTALRRYAETHSGATYIEMSPAVRTLALMLSRVAAAAGAGDMHRSAGAAETAIIERLQDRNALLIIDESHHLAPGFLDELRCIRDMARCGLVLAGQRRLSSTLAGNDCEQIVGRIGLRVALSKTPDEDVLAIVAGVIGEPPEGRTAEVVVNVAKDPGGLHALRRFIARAFAVAKGEGRDTLTPGDLLRVAD